MAKKPIVDPAHVKAVMDAGKAVGEARKALKAASGDAEKATAETALKEAEAALAKAKDEAKAATPAQDSDKAAAKPFATIQARRPGGFRRCGVHHPAEPVAFPREAFTDDQWARLMSEPALVVTEI